MNMNIEWAFSKIGERINYGGGGVIPFLLPRRAEARHLDVSTRFSVINKFPLINGSGSSGVDSKVGRSSFIDCFVQKLRFASSF